ncbi:AbrB/MazE/SpoVT family DNA-binding domain-containing protein [Verminephrobacter eiseniae]|nr:AbrB/MazE/SpoVT family DNA-binding domain-containing protein [Verminephrobacter eiseniae]KAB7591147.1 AbrB/MazE/SpoVT family DNA-binding domain-containing protein [Verminephrobacter sp. Larva24]MCW5231753.1 AbrB/MazE/SpoVT family DNA-binding domain-containing protein [Verminephrobacter eiseniae]MCW5293485.1 AbrB/MazE/SpoVT family DNA-binding domain-containing protein [Verminephrobacter eiseniae]MCW8187073.1 AbrB/MazE/SpoVT family DNA-binding domain-containing protein [Verminephrobacter eisen
MNTLTVSARGQVTFRKELLRHLGIEPGEKIEIDWLPGGRALRQAARPTASMASFVGLLAGRTGKPAPMCR